MTTYLDKVETPKTKQKRVRLETLRKVLEMAEEFGLSELSFEGVHLKRGGPQAVAKAETKPEAKTFGVATDDLWDVAQIDAANEPIMKAYERELGLEA